MHDSSHHPRHKRRWPVVLAETLGCTVIEEGLPGRMAAGHGDTVMGARDERAVGVTDCTGKPRAD